MLMAAALLAVVTGAVADEVEKNPFETLMEGFDEKDAADEDPRLEEVISGFEVESETETSPRPKVHRDRPVQLDGYLKLGGSWNVAHDAPQAGETDWRGLSRLR